MEIPGTSIITAPLGDVYSHRFDGNSNYHALLTKVERRFAHGFTILSSYTFSKAIGDTCGGAAQGNATGCGYQDPRNLRIKKSVDNQDVRIDLLPVVSTMCRSDAVVCEVRKCILW